MADSLIDVIRRNVVTFRKGPEIETRKVGIVDVTEVWAMPAIPDSARDPNDPNRLSVSEITFEDKGWILRDMEFFFLGVLTTFKGSDDEALFRAEVEKLDKSLLAGGAHYIGLGAELGDQEFALALMGMGDVIGMWSLITPYEVGFDGPEARDIAGKGLIYITPYPRNDTTEEQTQVIKEAARARRAQRG